MSMPNSEAILSMSSTSFLEAFSIIAFLMASRILPSNARFGWEKLRRLAYSGVMDSTPSAVTITSRMRLALGYTVST